MTLHEFLERWSIIENPFIGEEARHDSVFARLGLSTPRPVSPPGAPQVVRGFDSPPGPGAESLSPPAQASQAVPVRARRPGTVTHPDFEKILGDLDRPAAAIVFGEKGSGKTAIRLQIAQRIESYNEANPRQRVLLIAYDDLNPMLDALAARFATGRTSAAEALTRLRPQDHIDGILNVVVPRLVDSLVSGSTAIDLGPEGRRLARRADVPTRRDIVLLQSIYDRPEDAPARSARLRGVLRLNLPLGRFAWALLAGLGWIPAAALAAWMFYRHPEYRDDPVLLYILAGLAGLWVIVLLKVGLLDRLKLVRLGRRVRRQVRVIPRSERSWAKSLTHVHPGLRSAAHLPTTEADEPRYAMLRRLRRVLSAFGYSSLVIVADRVDEPALVRGDPDRMRAVVWPLLNNKLLQQEGVGIKLLLPIELRHLLFKESAAFFQEARLDKQNMIERLAWTGAMLYDLCDARLQACRPVDAAPITLLDLFAEDVTHQDIVEALDQMHQPRDAFKLLYQCFLDHCSSVAGPASVWRIPRHVLENVRKQQSDRVQQLYRGIRPA